MEISSFAYLWILMSKLKKNHFFRCFYSFLLEFQPILSPVLWQTHRKTFVAIENWSLVIFIRVEFQKDFFQYWKSAISEFVLPWFRFSKLCCLKLAYLRISPYLSVIMLGHFLLDRNVDNWVGYWNV